MPITRVPPLQGKDLAKAAADYRRHDVFTTIIKDTLCTVFFVLVIASICFANRDTRSYLHYLDISNNIAEPRDVTTFGEITTPGDFFTWMKDTVIPHLFPETDINGVFLHWSSRDFRSGYEDYRLGPPRLRQLRTVNETCFVPRMGEVKCNGKYSILAEEEGQYCIGWKQPPCNLSEQVYNVSSPAWTFTSAFDIWGLPLPGIYLTYSGGGYIANLAVSRNNSLAILDELFNNLWMDRQTRAVMLEFTLYNAATNMFFYNMFLVEFPETGGALTTFSIYPIRVYTHQGAIGAFTIFCEVIFVLYLVFLLVKMCIRTYQQRCSYFKQFWNIYELIMLIIGISAIAAFAIRLGLTVLTIREFKKDKKLFVNFSHIVLWDQILVALLGTLLFMATLRILQVFATSKKVSAILRIFSTCGKDLFWFGIMFLYIFLAFCFLGVFLFGDQLASYKNMYHSMATLFTAMIGYGIFSDIVETQPVLAKVFFMFYIILIVFFTLTIFMSILGASIDQVVQEDKADESEDIIEEIMKKIKYLLVNPSGKIPQNKIGTSSEENWKMLLKKFDESEFGNKKHICSCPSSILREKVKTSRAPVNHGLVPTRANVPPENGVGTKKSPVKTTRKKKKIISQ